MKKGNGNAKTESLRNRTGAEWDARLAALQCSEKVRFKARCIVWWDYSEKTIGGLSSKRFRELDDVMGKRGVSVPSAEIEAALLALGYAPREAKRRAIDPNEYMRCAVT
jgi:hypothetical protein